MSGNRPVRHRSVARSSSLPGSTQQHNRARIPIRCTFTNSCVDVRRSAAEVAAGGPTVQGPVIRAQQLLSSKRRQAQPSSLRVVSTLRLPTGYRHDLFTPRPHRLPRPGLRALTMPHRRSARSTAAHTTDDETHHTMPQGLTSKRRYSRLRRFLAP